ECAFRLVGGSEHCRRSHARDQADDERIDLLLALFLEKCAGYAHHHGEHRHQREQRYISQRGRADRTTVARKTLPYEHPEMREFLKSRQRALGTKKTFVPQAPSLASPFAEIEKTIRHLGKTNASKGKREVKCR